MFEIEIKENGKTVDVIWTDCLIAATHDGVNVNAYPTYFMADCDEITVARVLRAEMQNVQTHFTDKLIELALTDDTDLKGTPCEGCSENNNAEWDESTCPFKPCSKGGKEGEK